MDHNQLNYSHLLVSDGYISYCMDAYHICIVPTPTVSVTAPNTQTVGQSLTLQCNGTTVRGITSDVNILWRRGNTIIATTRVTAATTTTNNFLVYRDSYTISRLSTSDEGVVYECRLVVHSTPQVRANDFVTLDMTGKYFAW